MPRQDLQSAAYLRYDELVGQATTREAVEHAAQLSLDDCLQTFGKFGLPSSGELLCVNATRRHLHRRPENNARRPLARPSLASR